MHTAGAAHALFWVGSHSVPRFEAEPHTEWLPELVVTALQTLNVSAFLHASGPASASHAM